MTSEAYPRAMAMRQPPTLKQRIEGAWKSLFGYGSQYTWYGYRGGSWDANWRYSNSNIDFRSVAGELDQSTIIMACIQWIMRAWPEARPRVMLRKNDGDAEQNGHALTELLDNPNPYYDGLLLQQSLAASYNMTGNAFALKGRNSMGRVIRLWFEPHTTIRPAWPNQGDPRLDTEEGFITHYEIYRDYKWVPVPKENVIHIRFGIDPRNPRMGMNPLQSALREVYNDNEAATYTATLLKNMGVIGGIAAPKDDVTIDPEDAQNLKKELTARTTGDHRGEWTVFETPMDITIPTQQTNHLAVREVRWIPEERICALLGLPPGVVGMGTGLMRNTENNLGNSREQAYESNLIPTQMLFGAALTRQLLPEFSTNKAEFVDYDRSAVRVLADDEVKKSMATAKLYDSGIIKRSEARQRHDFKADADDEIYKSGPNAANAPLPDPGAVAPEPAPTNGNGNGKESIDNLMTVASGEE